MLLQYRWCWWRCCDPWSINRGRGPRPNGTLLFTRRVHVGQLGPEQPRGGKFLPVDSQKLQFPNQEERLWERQPDRGKLNKASPFQLKELCSLLNENYLEEDDNTVRFDFSPEYLQWWASRGRICSIRTLSVNGFLFLCTCSLSCRACARIQVFLKEMNHSLWQTADEYHQNSNQSGYHRSVLFDAPHPQDANLQLSWILIYLRSAIEYAENQVILFC